MLQRGLASSPLVASHAEACMGFHASMWFGFESSSSFPFSPCRNSKSIMLQRDAKAHVFVKAYLICSLGFGHKKGN